ncbi:thiol peroxidase [Brachybacterium huguangmaarense]|uniref:Thiol peroxidase n=1 Tax=Brachybacterium huguangmaarense TaxID=1652028 RepID=A0ABY6G0Z1_9MICO|nr:thiol peroxidase [Brachybacterium huguangmaarense]UYG16848.1 thiol peroxidase [Brachybacterium huguangmaarense]
MATTAFKGTPVHTVGELPAPGTAAPAVDLVGVDLSPVRSADFPGRRIVLNIFPSVDTGTCALSVRRFNELAATLENTVVVCASRDLPFAQARFCGAEGIENVVMGSAFRTAFGEDYGVTMTDGPTAGLLARSVVVIDGEGTVLHSQLVDEMSHEPDYDAALAALR